jgi:hypothetical protein
LPVSIGKAKPAVVLRLRLSQAAKVKVALVDAKQHVLASWTETEKKGSTKLELVLPVKARHTGHDTLQIIVAGKTKTVSIALIA